MLKDTQKIVTDFMHEIEQGYINPDQMVSVLQAMHACLVDRYPSIELWMDISLEQVSDKLCNANNCAESDENYNPEPTKD